MRHLFGDALLTLGGAAAEVLASPRFEHAIAALAERIGRPVAEVRAEAAAGLREIVAIQNPIFAALFDHVLGPMHTNAFTIDVEPGAVEQLRELDRAHALVFLPTHRSYADAFVLAEVLRRAGLPRNHILGGNNVDFFPLGTILRRSGGVLIRRSFRDDPVYKLVVREYLHHLVATGNNLEWYVEGGRSRSGKLLPPKYGLLRYLVDAVENGGAEDLMLVPVSTTYEQLHEVTAMVAEETGATKSAEGIGWLLDYARTQQKWIGKAYVRFGEPLSLRRALEEQNRGDDEPRPSRWAIEKVAFEVSRRINDATLVTDPALATLALLGVRDRARTLGDICHLVGRLLDYAEARGLPTEHLRAMRTREGLEAVLGSLVGSGIVARYDDGLEPVFKIAPGRHAVAAFYRNSAIHWFVNRAILEIGILSATHDGRPDSVERAWDASFALRDLFKFEFFFRDKEAFREEIKAESRLLSPDFSERFTRVGERERMLRDAPFLVAHRIFAAFLEAYFVVADRIAAVPGELPVDTKVIVTESLAVGRQYLLQQKLRHPECVSRELFKNAIALAENRGLIEPAGDDLGERRRALRRELRDAVSAVASIDDFDQARDRRSEGEAA